MRISDWSSDVCSSDLRLNGAVFWSDITSPQVLTTINTGTVSAVSLPNAQKARLRGAEASIEAVAARGLTLRGAVTYLDADYTKFTNRSEERRVGKECGSTSRTRWEPEH